MRELLFGARWIFICPPGAPIFSFYGPSTPIDRVIVDTVLGDSERTQLGNAIRTMTENKLRNSRIMLAKSSLVSEACSLTLD